MALLRLMHAAEMPDPAALMAQFGDGKAVAAAPRSAAKASAPAASAWSRCSSSAFSCA